jgi:hypothetical protein
MKFICRYCTVDHRDQVGLDGIETARQNTGRRFLQRVHFQSQYIQILQEAKFCRKRFQAVVAHIQALEVDKAAHATRQISNQIVTQRQLLQPLHLPDRPGHFGQTVVRQMQLLKVFQLQELSRKSLEPILTEAELSQPGEQLDVDFQCGQIVSAQV